MPQPLDGSPAGTVGPPALDAASAIELLDHSTELYCEVAQAFGLEIAELVPRMAALLNQADPNEAVRALHTCKGLSLTVGAKLLSEACRQCELQLKALRQNNQALDEPGRARMLVALNDAITQTQVALAAGLALLQQPAPGGQNNAAANLDVPSLHLELQALCALLEKSDLQALDRFAELQARHPLAQAALQGLGGAIKVFDFSQAVVQCQKLISHLSGPQ